MDGIIKKIQEHLAHHASELTRWKNVLVGVETAMGAKDLVVPAPTVTSPSPRPEDNKRRSPKKKRVVNFVPGIIRELYIEHDDFMKDWMTIKEVHLFVLMRCPSATLAATGNALSAVNDKDEVFSVRKHPDDIGRPGRQPRIQYKRK